MIPVPSSFTTNQISPMAIEEIHSPALGGPASTVVVVGIAIVVVGSVGVGVVVVVLWVDWVVAIVVVGGMVVVVGFEVVIGAVVVVGDRATPQDTTSIIVINNAVINKRDLAILTPS
ncbi:hypothetical protein ACFLYB_02890 [Chloroflexota bacterium]